MLRRIRYELFGVGMLAVAVGVVALSVLMFNQAFRDVTHVTVSIERAGLQLLEGSDVKVRGKIIGDVEAITSDGTGATISLRLNPSDAEQVPSNSSVRLIPKTVFGEKYVDIQLPDSPARPLREGDVIPEDRSTAALEINESLDNLLPLLRAVRPADLNATLNALATALQGRGEQLGQTIEELDAYFKVFNPHLPTLRDDMAALAQTTRTYDEAMAPLLELMRNLTVTSDTIVAQEAQLDAFLADLAGTADNTRDLLARNARNLVAVNVVNQKTVELFARYSPEFPCFFRGYDKLIPNIHGAVPKEPHLNNMTHVVVEFVEEYPTYKYPIDLPEFNDDRPPGCYGLPNPPKSQPRVQFKDGTEDNPESSSRDPGMDSAPASDTRGVATDLRAPLPMYSPAMGMAGTAEERRMVNTVLGPVLGTSASSVPDIAALLWGPMARGTEVRLS